MDLRKLVEYAFCFLGLFFCMTLSLGFVEKITGIPSYSTEILEELEVVPECYEIKSFSLHSENISFCSGSFVLGYGCSYSSSFTDLKYYFYKKGQVGFILCSVDAQRVEIVETDDKSPCIEGLFNDDSTLKFNETYIIYVPVGTIFEEYKVEL